MSKSLESYYLPRWVNGCFVSVFVDSLRNAKEWKYFIQYEIDEERQEMVDEYYERITPSQNKSANPKTATPFSKLPDGDGFSLIENSSMPSPEWEPEFHPDPPPTPKDDTLT